MDAVNSGATSAGSSWWYPTISVVIGFALSQVSELYKSHLARSKDKDERRIVFQRTVLIDLQETLVSLVRTSGQLHMEDVDMGRKHGEPPTRPYNAETQRLMDAATAKMMALTQRVASTELRASLEDLRKQLDRSEEHGASREGLLAFISSTKLFEEVNAEIGRHLREDV
jgi:hypothetical protein